MVLSHRARLTLVSAGSAGAAFLVLFGLSTVGLRKTEQQSAQSELTRALTLVVGDMREFGKPNLAEVVASNPEIGLAVYDARGTLVLHDGLVLPPPATGEGEANGLVFRAVKSGESTVVAAESWSKHQELLNRFTLLCAALWLPLVGIVALATWITARATFLPLVRLAREAEDLSVESLSSRLQVDVSGEYREFVLRLNRFLDKLESSLRREERFLSDAAHEMRTPLTVLRGEIETALIKERTGEEYRETLDVLHNETSRLSSLVELLLRSAAPAAQDVGCIDLAEAAERAHARWVDRFAQRDVQLDLTLTAAQANLADAEFDVLVDNLLANALHASPRSSTCGIFVEGAQDKVRLRVQDQGPGVPPSEVERIFERFARSDSGRSRSDGGFGIGLALCKRIVEAHGGRIWVEPNDPTGSNFVIELPAA
jgi:two-component system, OmpR family, sensor kinase